MDSRHLARLAHDLVVARGVAPLACVAVGRWESGSWRFGMGGASMAGPDRGSTSTVFDLASITKPIVATAAARLTQHRMLRLEDPLGALLDPVRTTSSARSPLSLFLSHRSGLAAYLPLYLALLKKQTVSPPELLIAAASARRPDCVGAPGADGFAPLYSDLGYMLAGAALQSVSGLALDTIVEQEVAGPLGLAIGSVRQWMGRDAHHFQRNVAATEVVSWRGGLVAGVVHDENAWALSGHASMGHAGLFATADAVVRFGAAVVDAVRGRSDWLMPTIAWELVRPRPGGTLRAGFDGKSATGSCAGTRAGPATFGHLGFTGTSLWCDPDAGLVTVLLSNRVHPTRANTSIRTARPLVHDALAEIEFRELA